MQLLHVASRSVLANGVSLCGPDDSHIIKVDDFQQRMAPKKNKAHPAAKEARKLELQYIQQARAKIVSAALAARDAGFKAAPAASKPVSDKTRRSKLAGPISWRRAITSFLFGRPCWPSSSLVRVAVDPAS